MSEQGPGLAQRIFSRLFGERKTERVSVADESPHQLSSRETAEIPHEFLVVVADDEIDVAENTRQSLEQVWRKNHQNGRAVEIASNAMDIFRLALVGNAGKAADAVILDDAYIRNGSLWRPNPDDVIALAKSSDVNFSAFEEEVEIPPVKGATYKPIELLCMQTNSTNFALILRALGYQGKIFVVSSAPPPPSWIRESLNQIRSVVPSFPEKLPIDGVSHKRDHDGHGLEYANSEGENGYWAVQQDPTVHDLSGTLGILLQNTSNS